MGNVKIMLPCTREHDFHGFTPSSSARVWYFFSLAVFEGLFEVPVCREEAVLEPAGHLYVCFGLSWSSPWAFFRFSAVPFVPPGSRANLLVSFGEAIVP